jgi:hypothetical protein
MKKDSKQRLFEVMGRLDKSFKPKLNEDFEGVPAEEPMAALPSGDENGEEQKEKSPEEKLQELTAKVDEMYALLHGEEQEVEPEMGGDAENLQEWNFDKKKGEKKEEKDEKPKGKTQFNFDKKEDKEEKEHEDSETPAEEKEEHEDKKEIDEVGSPSKKIPVAAIAKVGK